MQELEKVLNKLGESSQFATCGSLPPVLPGLDLKGVGSIGTPVSPADAKRLIGAATQAPYGLGEKTVVDLKVRRVWQLEPPQFSLRNPDWHKHVAEIVAAVTSDFGIGQKVEASLYKLLIYEKGSFFTAHCDTEKVPGMFATLVVGLPSRHEGGTLIVKHEGQTRKIDFGGEDSEFKTQYAAFYADCQHETKPVTAGYRLPGLQPGGHWEKEAAARAESAAAVDRSAELLRRFFTDEPDGPNKIVIPFMHQYTEAGFDPRHLKGTDRACAGRVVTCRRLARLLLLFRAPDALAVGLGRLQHHGL